MIDWTTVIVPFRQGKLIHGGFILSSNTDGEVEWQRQRGLQVTGSHDSSIQVKTSDADGHALNYLWISGNPAKYLYGHNITGSDDLCTLVADMANRITESLGLHPSEDDYQRWLSGNFQVKKVDINYMRHCGSRANARSLLRTIGSNGVMKHGGRGQFTGDTLYFGKKSRRRAIKMYCKGDELEQGGKHHQLPKSIAETYPELVKLADDSLRIELVLHSPEIKKLNLHRGAAWKSLDVENLFNSYVSRIECSPNFSLASSLLSELPPYLVRTYSFWNAGVDLRGVLSRDTYYRHRRELKAFGIDIAALPTAN